MVVQINGISIFFSLVLIVLIFCSDFKGQAFSYRFFIKILVGLQKRSCFLTKNSALLHI